MLDMTESIAPKSDQLNAEDLLTGPRTFTIAEVKRGDAEQPIHVHLVEFPGRPFKPSKTVRRIMVGAWGADAATYAGKRMTLYRDPDVRFGGQEVGGIRVSHMSDLKKPLKMALTTTRGKRAPFVVQPLGEQPAPTPTAAAEDAPAATPAGPNEHERAAQDFADQAMQITDRSMLASLWRTVPAPLRNVQVADGNGELLALGELFSTHGRSLADAETTAESQPPTSTGTPADAADTATDAQLRKLHAALGEIGLSEREARLEYLTEHLGRQVTTSKSLTKAEASLVIDRIEKFLDPDRPDADQ